MRDQGRGLTGKSSSWTAFMYLRLVCCGITHLTAQGPSRTCNERQDEEDSGRAKAGGCVTGLSRRLGWASFSGATLARCHFLEPPWQESDTAHGGCVKKQTTLQVARLFSRPALGRSWKGMGAGHHTSNRHVQGQYRRVQTFVPGTSANRYPKTLKFCTRHVREPFSKKALRFPKKGPALGQRPVPLPPRSHLPAERTRQSHGTYKTVKARFRPHIRQSGPNSGPNGTYKTVMARCWPWTTGESPQNLSFRSHFAGI